MTEPGLICRTCGQTHEGVPLSFAADFPDLYVGMSEPERAVRAVVSSDQCIVDEEIFFIRGCLEIPILDSGGDVFLWGLWALVKEEVFNEISESWDEEGRETRRGPFKARLANSLSVYPETLNLKIRPRRRNLWAKASVRDGCRRGTSGAFCRWNQQGRMPRSSLAVSAARRVRMSVM